MTRRFARAVRIQKRGVQLLAVLGAELENVADFDGAADFQRLAAFPQGSPAVTVRKSNHAVTLMSRSMETFFKWKPSSFAPVVMSLAPCKRSSA